MHQILDNSCMCECEAALYVANILPKILATMVNIYVSIPLTMGQRKPKKKKKFQERDYFIFLILTD